MCYTEHTPQPKFSAYEITIDNSTSNDTNYAKAIMSSCILTQQQNLIHILQPIPNPLYTAEYPPLDPPLPLSRSTKFPDHSFTI